MTPAADPAPLDLSLTIAVLSYRRPVELAACLPLIAEHAAATRKSSESEFGVAILVVDNDPLESARPVVRAVERQIAGSGVPLRYVAEPTPGIAAARNRAIDETIDSDVLVFIDDDERPTVSWLLPLVHTWERTGAAAVMGRVQSVFDARPDPWVEAGEFFRRRRMPTGTEIAVGAAGNLLLDLLQVHRLGVRFDERLNLGAGEDSLFTMQLVRRGGRMVWCDESVATDHVPPERVTRRWVLDRARSHGNTETVVALLLADTEAERRRLRAQAATRGSVRVAAGSARFALGVATGSLRHQARGLRTVYRGLGIASGAVGVAVQEYAREPERVDRG